MVTNTIQLKSLITIALLLAGCGGESYEIGISDHDTGDGPRLVASSSLTGDHKEPPEPGTPPPVYPVEIPSVQVGNPTETEAHAVSPDAGSVYGEPLNCEELKPCDRYVTIKNLDTSAAGCENIMFAVRTDYAPGNIICIHARNDIEQRLAPSMVFMLGEKFGASGSCVSRSTKWSRFAITALPNPEPPALIGNCLRCC